MPNDQAVPWMKQAPPPTSIFRTRQHGSQLTLARFGHDGAECFLRSAIEDSFVAVIMVGKEPEHEFYHDEKLCRGTADSRWLKFVDLNADAYCWVHGPLDHFHLHMPRAALNNLAHEAGAPSIGTLSIPADQDPFDPILEGLKQALITATSRPEETNRLLVDQLVLALYIHFARAYGGLRALEIKTGGLAPWQERRAKEAIEANLDREISIADISATCGLSATHFSRAFKASTGMTPYGWLQSCRIKRAKEMMQNPDVSLAHIALTCGFADQSHFTRIFARVEGGTPGAWRRNRRVA